MFGQLFVMSAVAVAGYLTGRLQAYLMIWLFFVPARCKLPLVFNAFRGALPWLAGFLVPIFFVEEGRKYGLEDFEGRLLAFAMCAFLIGLHVFSNRFAELMQNEGWMSAGGTRNAKIWAGCLALFAAAFVMYQAMSAPT